MTDQNRTILQWVLGIGILIGGAKVVMDLSKGSPTPPAVADAPKPKPSASDTAAADPLLPNVGPGNTGHKPQTPPTSGSVAATEDNPLAQMQQVLAEIAKDPVAHNPTVTQKDPENGLLLYGFEIQGLQQPVLAIIDGKPEAWAWSFGANIPPQLFAPQGKSEPGNAPGQGAQATKLLDGPLSGCIVITVDEQPRVRVIKSVGFQAFEQAAEAAAASGSGAPGGKPAPSSTGRKGQK